MAVRIDASGKYLSRTASLPAIGAFTLCGWFNVSADRGSVDQPLMAICRAATADVYLTWETNDAANTFAVGSYTGTSDNAGNFASRPATGTWFFAYLRCLGTGAGNLQGGWRRATDAAFVQATTALGTGASFTGATLQLGAWVFSGGWCNCTVDDFKVFGSALSDAQLLALMARREPTQAPNAWNSLFGTLTDAVKDLSGNGFDLTATGSPSVVDGAPLIWGYPQLERGVRGVARGVAA